MHNKIKSVANRGKRAPGRPFNTTSYPWRSIAIGRSFRLRTQTPPGGQFMAKLRAEGRDFKYTLKPGGYTVITRIA
jgi:hypothetical protein